MTLAERMKHAAARVALAVSEASLAVKQGWDEDGRGAQEAEDRTRDDLIREQHGTPEERLEFAIGGLEYREWQLAKFNGKQETMEDMMATMHAQLNAAPATPEMVAAHQHNIIHATVLPTPLYGDDGGDE